MRSAARGMRNNTNHKSRITRYALAKRKERKIGSGIYYVPLLALIVPFILSSCHEQYTPKLRGYERIDFPKRNYHKQEVEGCNYGFELADFAFIKPDPYPGAEACWHNVHFPSFGATLHLSYKKIGSRPELFKLINDSRTMVYKHVMKADEIIENYISQQGKHGIFYELNGNTATNAQFYVTDSTSHFLRGSLYFTEKTSEDSLAPSLHFLKIEMLHMIQTLHWD